MNRAVQEADLNEWDARLHAIWEQKPVDLFDLAMSDTVRAYPSLDIVPFEDMIAGMVMDVPGHPQVRHSITTTTIIIIIIIVITPLPQY